MDYVITNGILLMVFIGGVALGLMWNKDCPIKVEPKCNESLTVYTGTRFYNWTNICCYPSDCPQAKNNPEECTCIYMVECYGKKN